MAEEILLAELELLKKELKSKNEYIESQTKVINAIRTAIQCPICLSQMKKPCILSPCGHAACYRCMHKWFSQRPQDEHGAIRRQKKCCPTCRTRVLSRPTQAFLFKSLQGALDSHPLNEGDNTIDDISVKADDDDEDEVKDLWEGIFPREGSGAAGMWDAADNVRRCTECGSEVVHGVCANPECEEVFDIESADGYPEDWDGESDGESMSEGDDDGYDMEDSFIDDVGQEVDVDALHRRLHPDPTDDEDEEDVDRGALQSGRGRIWRRLQALQEAVRGQVRPPRWDNGDDDDDDEVDARGTAHITDDEEEVEEEVGQSHARHPSLPSTDLSQDLTGSEYPLPSVSLHESSLEITDSEEATGVRGESMQFDGSSPELTNSEANTEALGSYMPYQGYYSDHEEQEKDEDAWVLPQWEPPARLLPPGLGPLSPHAIRLVRRGVPRSMSRRYNVTYSHRLGLLLEHNSITYRLGWNIHLQDDDDHGQQFVEKLVADVRRGENGAGWVEAEGDHWDGVRKVKRDERTTWENTDSDEAPEGSIASAGDKVVELDPERAPMIESGIEGDDSEVQIIESLPDQLVDSGADSEVQFVGHVRRGRKRRRVVLSDDEDD